MTALLEIKDLQVEVDGKPILNGVNLTIPCGETHVLMGPNGSGKSTLSNVIMGHPNYKVIKGDILLDGESIINMPTDERARKGIFLSFQSPVSIPGVTVHNFLRHMLQNIRGGEINFKEFRHELKEEMDKLSMREDFAKRYVNDGFSGGERKRNEILQMAMTKPKLAVLDEIDSGLDIDALRIIAENIEKQRSPERSMLLITHYQRLLNYLTIDKVHIYMNGAIIQTGGRELAEKLEQRGYDWVKEEMKV